DVDPARHSGGNGQDPGPAGTDSVAGGAVMTAEHVPAGLLARYVASGTSPGSSHVDDSGGAWWWVVEVHLEHCPVCRDRVRAAVAADDGLLAADLRRVR